MGTQPRTGYERVEPRMTEPAVKTPEGAEPTDEQLCSVAVLLGFPMLATPMFKRLPHWRQSMLNLHALAQRAICGDEEASRALSHIVEAFSEGPVSG